jgi:hypothetical protein
MYLVQLNQEIQSDAFFNATMLNMRIRLRATCGLAQRQTEQIPHRFHQFPVLPGPEERVRACISKVCPGRVSQIWLA